MILKQSELVCCGALNDTSFLPIVERMVKSAKFTSDLQNFIQLLNSKCNTFTKNREFNTKIYVPR